MQGPSIAFGGGTALTVKLLNQDRAPSALARSYLEALASGDARRATEMIDPGVRNSERELLTNATLESAEQLIEVVGLETIARTSSTALVRATYSLDGEHFEHDFRLTREPQEMLFLESWKLAEPLLLQAKVGVEGLQSLKVGDTEISVPQGGGDDTSAVTPSEDDGSRTVFLYPGLYRLSAADNPYVTTSTEELRAIPSDTLAETTFWVRMKPKPTFELEILQQVRLRIDQCAAKPTNLDRVCPEYLRQKDLLEAEVLSQADRFEEIGIGYFRSAEAVVKVRPGPNPLNADPGPEEHRFAVEGRIEFRDGEPKIRDLEMREIATG
ncbi:hypothetical protein G7067_03010 [Leucobacter insecticola]|uniref:Uncharacterized protein n=1 Tax=Leucobacter insecticola TaxID=2714934 RepID=A0A6G8FH68_9MICO|nr:hypothetical protein [Leucobacter insecticola]QIM15619.1 hypothetical protein G7067_03010 [Leucobacter insecticola]